MKKLSLFLLCFLFLFKSEPAFAILSEKVLVKSLANYKKIKIKSPIYLEVADVAVLKSGKVFYKGNRIKCYVMDIKNPKRLKQDGYIIVVFKDSDGKKIFAKTKEYNPNLKKDIAKSCSLTLLGQKIPFVSESVAFAQGVIKPEESKSRLKSGLNKAYDASFVSNVEYGETCSFKKNDLFYLVLIKPDSRQAKKLVQEYNLRYK